MKHPVKRQTLSGWGRYPLAACDVFRPEKAGDPAAVLNQNQQTLLARGLGKSYGDAALNPAGVISTERLARFLAFDMQQGLLTCQPGVSLAEILEVIVPMGWFLPVLPGTKFASLGGCVACNIHGKNHFSQGDLARHVRSLTLLTADGTTIKCSPTEDFDVFWATAGGMGMTGMITEITLKLQPIKSIYLTTQARKVADLDEMAVCFREGAGNADYMMGWIDHFASGKHLGRGVFEQATHTDAGQGLPEKYRVPKPGLTIPSFFPGVLLNKYSMAVYNRLRFARVPTQTQPITQTFDGFFHPLDALNQWNRLYGKRGFLQYQCLFPDGPEVVNQMRTVLGMMREAGLASFLAVIKYHGSRLGGMSFPDKGFSIAFDFKNQPKVHGLLDAIDEKISAWGGRIYLAKDARLRPEMFESMYGDALPMWRKILKELDPNGVFNSEQGRRLGFREARHG